VWSTNPDSGVVQSSTLGWHLLGIRENEGLAPRLQLPSKSQCRRDGDVDLQLGSCKMKRTRSLHTLFATLVAGCGPSIFVGDEAGSTSDDDASATTADTTGTDSSPSSTETSYGTYDEYGSGACWEEHYEEGGDVPRSELLAWLDEDGQIPFDLCTEACWSVGLGLGWDAVSDCAVWGEPTDDGDSTMGSDSGDVGSTGDMDGTTGDTDVGDTTGDTGEDELMRLECAGIIVICGEGRGHEALQSAPMPTAGDAVGRWAAAAAHAEAASIAAFLALRAELVAHDAPTDLVDRALDAALDEVVHARMMAAIAARRGATPTRPRFGPIEVRALEAFAIENAVEGCVRETWSALQATHQASAATDPEVRTAMRRIADDETRHAELAHDIDSWLRMRLGPEAIARVEHARDCAVADLLQTLDQSAHPALQAEAGFAPPQTARRLAEGLSASLWN
jgi:hypothetical protein